jgi:hypothetical protein
MLRPVARFLFSYFFAIAVAVLIVHRETSLHPLPNGEVIASVWKDGQLIERAVLADARQHDARLDRAVSERGGELIYEKVVADGPILQNPPVALGVSLVAGHDGVRATLGDKTVYVTPDDLLSRQIYDHGLKIQSISITLGLDTDRLLDLVAERLETNRSNVEEHASLRRIRVERHRDDERPRITPANLTPADVRAAVVAYAQYLAHGVSSEGRFRYTVNAPTDQELPGYDWPRHSGATFFLAQAAALTQDPALAAACGRAAGLLRGAALSKCGDLPCVGDEPVVNLGSSALALLAFAEIVDRDVDRSFRPQVVDLARFLRKLQRPDGEFMHEYNRVDNRPIDHQGLYYSSEATLALARAYGITHDPADLDAAVRGLRNIVGPAWSFFGDKYYFGEEHWTCQAMAVLWPYAPDPKALDFCIRWQAYGRKLQQQEGDSYFDADGALGLGPVVTPRLTPVASRCEAAVATLDIAKKNGIAASEVAALDLQLRRALGLLLRQQFKPGPRHLFKSPDDVYGAMPGSEVDWELRIDYAQHAGSAMVRWLDVNDPSATVKR